MYEDDNTMDEESIEDIVERMFGSDEEGDEYEGEIVYEIQLTEILKLKHLEQTSPAHN